MKKREICAKYPVKAGRLIISTNIKDAFKTESDMSRFVECYNNYVHELYKVGTTIYSNNNVRISIPKNTIYSTARTVAFVFNVHTIENNNTDIYTYLRNSCVIEEICDIIKYDLLDNYIKPTYGTMMTKTIPYENALEFNTNNQIIMHASNSSNKRDIILDNTNWIFYF